MKKRLFSLVFAVLIISVLSGCSLMAFEARIDAAEDAVDARIDHIEDRVEDALRQSKQDEGKNIVSDSTGTSVDMLTAEQAQAIALKHAGYTAEQVTRLYTRRDRDDGVLQYEVQFRVGYLEYDYDIHTDNGKILSVDVDD